MSPFRVAPTGGGRIGLDRLRIINALLGHYRHCARSRTRRMIVAMIDANHISERLASLRLEMSDLRVANARYWSRKEHTALDKQASALRQQRLIEIKLEFADMSKRCA